MRNYRIRLLGSRLCCKCSPCRYPSKFRSHKIEHGVPVCFPSTVPRSGTPLPSTGSRGQRFANFIGTIGALRLPAAHPASFRFLHSAVPRTAALRQAAGSCWCRLLLGTSPGASILCLRPHSWRRQDLPGSSATPLRTCSAPTTPADRLRQATTTLSMLPSVALHHVGSASCPLSRLNHTACLLAVYASQLGLLRSHHARLASR